jgi:hypothetical protein
LDAAYRSRVLACFCKGVLKCLSCSYQGLKFGEESNLPSGSPLSHDVTVYIWNNYWIEPDRLGTIRASRNVELRNVKQHLIKNFFLSDLSKALPKGFYAFVPLQAPA